jgi:hypothetical protein
LSAGCSLHSPNQIIVDPNRCETTDADCGLLTKVENNSKRQIIYWKKRPKIMNLWLLIFVKKTKHRLISIWCVGTHEHFYVQHLQDFRNSKVVNFGAKFLYSLCCYLKEYVRGHISLRSKVEVCRKAVHSMYLLIF